MYYKIIKNFVSNKPTKLRLAPEEVSLHYECKQFLPKNPPKVIVFFITGFKTKSWFYARLIKQLNGLGIAVYAYDYAWRPLLEARPEQWVGFSELLNQDISQKIAESKKVNNQCRFGIIGVSVGSIVAMHAAKIFPELEKIMLVTVYGSSAQHVWEHPLLTKMKQKFEASNLSVKEAYDIFGHIEPTYRLDLIGKRQILLFANPRDKVIRYSNTKLLIDEAKKLGIDLQLEHIDSIRHSTTILKVLQSPELWLPFFKVLVREND